MNTSKHYTDDSEKQLNLHASLLTKKQQDINIFYDHRAGVMELCHGHKVLVWLDTYRGAHRKLKNRWGSMLHMVVGQIADDVPAYVIENKRGKQKVFHQVRLLLWSSAEEEEGLQMTAAQLAIQVSMLVLESLLIGEERSRVLYAFLQKHC